MRRSVQLCDALVYLPAALAHGVAAVRGRHRWLPLLQLVLLPALVLVDHGHFQYNCVSLGLALWAFTAALRGRPLACAFCFTLALNFKQMSLYLAPAIFCYLLAGCLRAATKTAAALRVARLGAVVLATTALCWAPFLGSWADARAVLVRVFPVGRHLYEDKVASVWCTLALTPLKLKHLLSIPTLVRLTLGVTLAALGPPCAMLLARPSRAGFLLGATACALAFFLLSFQVHEKHVLLPLLPAALLAPRCPAAFGWLAAVASFSMYPMLKRDGDPWSLRLPYAVTQLLFTALSLDPAAFGLPRRPPPPSCQRRSAGPSAPRSPGWPHSTPPTSSWRRPRATPTSTPPSSPRTPACTSAAPTSPPSTRSGASPPPSRRTRRLTTRGPTCRW